MAKTISSLSVGLFGNVGQFARAFGGTAVKAVNGFVGSVAAAGSKLLAFTGIGAAIGGAVGAIAGIGKGFSLAASFEQTAVAMETMLGSADAAKRVLADLQQFAATTPFEFPELADSTKKLIAFGVEQDKLLPSLRAIGDIAAGIGAPVNELAELYGKAKVQGRLFAQDINQLTNRGIPIIQELAKQFGVTEDKVKELVESGQVNFGNLERAFANLTGEGGKFAGMMDKQSGTLSGLFSTLKDTLGFTLMGIAQTIIDTFNIKDGIRGLTTGLASAGTAVTAWVGRVAPIIKSVGQTVFTTFGTVYQAVAPVVARVFGIVARTFTATVRIAAAVGMKIWAVVTGIWQSIYGFVAPIVQGIYDIVARTWEAQLTSVTAYVLGIWGVVQAVWGVIVEFAQWVWSGIAAVWNWGTELITGKTMTAGEATVGIFGKIGEWSRWLMDKVTYAFNVMEYVIRNWRATMELVGMKAVLGIVRFANQVHYFFVEAIPYTLGYFGRNWKGIFTDLWNYTLTVFKNLGSNIVRIIKNIPKLIKGQVSFSDLWTPLGDGFKSAVEENFELPERVKGDFEKQLESDVAQLEEEWVGGLAEHLARKQKEAEDAAKGIAKGIKDIVSPPEAAKPKIEPPKVEAPKVPPVKLDAMLNEDNLKLTVTPEIKRAKAITFGSAEGQLLRLRIPELAAAAAAAGGKAGGIGAAAAAPKPAVPAAIRPQPVEESRGGTEFWKQQIAATNRGNDALDRIEANTRNATALKVATF